MLPIIKTGLTNIISFILTYSIFILWLTVCDRLMGTDYVSNTRKTIDTIIDTILNFFTRGQK